MIQDRDRRKAAHAIGHHLLPKCKLRDQAYWCKHWPILKQLPSLGAIMAERRHFFRKTRSRNDAWLLITTTDLVWQSIRALAGKAGSDRTWLDCYLPENHRVLFPKGSSLSFVPLEEMVDEINWVYGLHSQLRHPGSNAEQLETTLWDPWPYEQADRLDVAAQAAGGVLKTFEVAFGLGNGFKIDLEEKATLAYTARKHWRVAACRPSP